MQLRLNETSKLKIELECQLNDFKKKDNENNNYLNTSDLQSLKAKDEIIEGLKTKLSKFQLQSDKEAQNLDSNVKKSAAQIETLSNRNFKNRLKTKNLISMTFFLTKAKDYNESLQAKDKEVYKAKKELEDTQEKLRSYLEKAKIVIRSLDPSKNSAASDTEIQYLKQTVAEKDILIKKLTVSEI